MRIQFRMDGWSVFFPPPQPGKCYNNRFAADRIPPSSARIKLSFLVCFPNDFDRLFFIRLIRQAIRGKRNGGPTAQEKRRRPRTLCEAKAQGCRKDCLRRGGLRVVDEKRKEVDAVATRERADRSLIIRLRFRPFFLFARRSSSVMDDGTLLCVGFIDDELPPHVLSTQWNTQTVGSLARLDRFFAPDDTAHRLPLRSAVAFAVRVGSQRP